MDKDMERLGKERLKRVKRRRQLATFVISMAVIVLSITVYRLIQPASAADQNKAEFTVDGETLTYKNLDKLTNRPSAELTSDKPFEWKGEKFSLNATLNFKILQDESNEENSVNNYYYYTYDPSFFIPDELCNKWYPGTDKTSKKAFEYHFVKNADGTYAVIIKFVDGYIKSSDVEGSIEFNAEGYGTVKDDGNVEIKVGGDATIIVDKTRINWNHDSSVNYDINVEKRNVTDDTLKIDENGRRYAEYVVDVSSQKGTPDDIAYTDVFESNGMIVDMSNISVEITKNGQPVDSKYNLSVAQDSSNSNNYIMSGTIPKLDAGDKCQVIYKYYIDTSNLPNVEERSASNKVTVESSNKTTGEGVIDTSSSVIKYTRNDLDKTGEYKDGVIKWTITVNSDCNDIAGAIVTDEMFKDAIHFQISSEQDTNNEGFDLDLNNNKIIFKKLKNGKNNSKYTIIYETKPEKDLNAHDEYNKVILKNRDVEITKNSSTWVPGYNNDTDFITKKNTNAVNNEKEQMYVLDWETSFKVPKSGIPKDSVFNDALSNSLNNSTSHYMTYDQVKEAFDKAINKFGDTVGNFKVKYVDDNGTWKDEDFSGLQSDTKLKFINFSFQFVKDYIEQNVGEDSSVFTLKYSSCADYSNGGEITFYNRSTFANVNATADFKVKEPVISKIYKTDENFQQATRYIKTSECDGTLVWIVKVTADKNSTSYEITDNMPKGITVQKVGVQMKWYSKDSMYYMDDFDGQEHRVDSKYWSSEGIITSSKKTANDGHEVITTVVRKSDDVEPRYWGEDNDIFIRYECKIDAFDDMQPGDELTFTNTASAKSDKNNNIGEASHTQIVNKPSDGGHDTPDSGDKIISKNGTWDNDTHTLNYSVLINPQGNTYLDEGKMLDLSDVLTYKRYTNNAWPTSNAYWQMNLNPNSVKFYEAIKKDDGSYEKGDELSDCTWKYSENDGNGQWDNDERTITATVPDGKAILLEYKYVVTATKEDKNQSDSDFKPNMYASNTVTVVGIENGKSDSQITTKYSEVGTSGHVYKNNSIVFYKVDSDNYQYRLPNAEFTLYRYDANSQDGYVADQTFKTDKDGSFTISLSKNNLTPNTQYYVVETKAPEGYIMPDNPDKYFFYFSGDMTKYPVCAPDGKLSGNSLANNYMTEYVENAKIPTTSINVEKQWIDSDNNLINKKDGSFFIQVRQVGNDGQDKVYKDAIEIKPDQDGNWKYTLSDLPINEVDKDGRLTGITYKYYVKETGVDENHQMKGYEVSYVVKNADGNIIQQYNKNVTPDSSSAIDAGTIGITNTLNVYELPETGGSGNRWLYMLSGVVLMTIAAITLFYKKQKLI